MGTTPAEDELLTVDQLAKRLQVAPVTVRLWTRNGSIPVTRCSRLLRYRFKDVLAAFEREQRRRSAGTAPCADA